MRTKRFNRHSGPRGSQDLARRVYLGRTTGQAICPTCGQLRQGASGFLVTRAIANYQLLHADRLPSANAISARLAHVVDYITTLPSPAISCEAVDEGWVARFRTWAERQAIVSSKGNSRPRSLGTIETVSFSSAPLLFASRRSAVTRCTARDSGRSRSRS